MPELRCLCQSHTIGHCFILGSQLLALCPSHRQGRRGHIVWGQCVGKSLPSEPQDEEKEIRKELQCVLWVNEVFYGTLYGSDYTITILCCSNSMSLLLLLVSYVPCTLVPPSSLCLDD